MTESAERGLTRISERSLTTVFRAVAAEALGVPHARVDARLSDGAGDLVVSVTSPLRVPPLDRLRVDDVTTLAAGRTLTERAHAAQHVIADRGEALTGTRPAQVRLRITGVEVQCDRRVR